MPQRYAFGLAAMTLLLYSCAPCRCPRDSTSQPDGVEIFRTSFEDVIVPERSGIISNATVLINTSNVPFEGGAKAIEIQGELGGRLWPSSAIFVDFSIEGLTGRESIDLRKKTLNFAFFIPEDSVVDRIYAYVGKRGHFDRIGEITADDWWTKGEWHDCKFDVSKVQGVGSDSDTIRISGTRLSEGRPPNAIFLVDDIRWIELTNVNKIPIDNNVDSLRKYAAGQHFKLGLFTFPFPVLGPEDDIWHEGIDPWYAYSAAQEGTVNTVSFFSIKANESYLNFDYNRPEDSYLLLQYNFGNANNMTVLGYGIGGLYSASPTWLIDLDFPDAIKPFLLYHIEKDLRFTQGQKPIWLLFNEFIRGPEFSYSGLRNRQNTGGDFSPWAADENDTSLVEAALARAREIDPEATLLLNDYENEQMGFGKSDYHFQIASRLKTNGSPIDGVGFQMHNIICPDGTLRFYIAGTWPRKFLQVPLDVYLDNIDRNVKRYNDIGLKVAFTEIDGNIRVDDLTLTSPQGKTEYANRLQWQAGYYAGLLKIALTNPNVILFHMWGISDRYDSVVDAGMLVNGEKFKDAYIFDKYYNPKPAYFAMLNLLKTSF